MPRPHASGSGTTSLPATRWTKPLASCSSLTAGGARSSPVPPSPPRIRQRIDMKTMATATCGASASAHRLQRRGPPAVARRRHGGDGEPQQRKRQRRLLAEIRDRGRRHRDDHPPPHERDQRSQHGRGGHQIGRGDEPQRPLSRRGAEKEERSGGQRDGPPPPEKAEQHRELPRRRPRAAAGRAARTARPAAGCRAARAPTTAPTGSGGKTRRRAGRW